MITNIETFLMPESMAIDFRYELNFSHVTYIKLGKDDVHTLNGERISYHTTEYEYDKLLEETNKLQLSIKELMEYVVFKKI